MRNGHVTSNAAQHLKSSYPDEFPADSPRATCVGIASTPSTIRTMGPSRNSWPSFHCMVFHHYPTCETRYIACFGVSVTTTPTASQMVMPPDQASFNARFLNNIPLEWKREMIAHDRIRADFSSNKEMIRAISHVDEIIDGLKMSSAYKSGYYTRTSTTATTSHSRTLPSGKRAEEPKPRWKEDSSSKYSRKTDQKSVPICDKCGKLGQTKDCPK